MRFREVKDVLRASAEPPAEPEERVRWLEGRDIPKFLEGSSSGDVPIYLSGDPLYLYSAFVPQRALKGTWVKEGLEWNFSVPQGWGYGTRYDKARRRRPAIFPPLDDTGSRLFDGAEPTILRRTLEGRGPTYLELNQRFAHVAGIHRIDDRNAYCRLDENGDFEDVVSMGRNESGWICTAKRAVLDFYMFLSGTVLVRIFDVHRPFPTWGEEARRSQSTVSDPAGTIFARRTLAWNESGQLMGGLLRGFQVVRCGTPREKLWRTLSGEPLEPPQYTSFLIQDWKNKRVVEWSCDPAKLGNYFVKSDLPFQTSPAFFRPEVLSKYKQDPDKYELDVRHVQCRSAWYLKSYDINEEGQVHAYIGDLGELPYSEQLHWKQFNERPKGGISKRAFQTDCEASWDVDPDPVWEIRALLRDFPSTGDGSIIWSTPAAGAEKALESVRHVVTDSAKEWRDEILDLSKLVVEGFETSALRKVAGSLGCDNSKLRSLKLIRQILEARSVNDNVIREICDPLDELQAQRSEKAAHGLSGRPPANPREDFRSRLIAVKGSLERLSDLVREGVFDLGGEATSSG